MSENISLKNRESATEGIRRMARPLTKIDPGGALYKRPISVETQIDEVLLLSPSALQKRLFIADRNNAGYLSSECLVHLVREGRRSLNQLLMNTVLPVLLGRCEVNLFSRIPEGKVPDAASLREEILAELAEMFAMDGVSASDELDFFECRFNRAFMTLRVDAIRQDQRRRKRTIAIADLSIPELLEAEDELGSDEDILARLSEACDTRSTEESNAFLEQIVDAIETLPTDERDAVILVHVLGYKEESEISEEETAATLCKCTGRTIRNRLTRAAAKLSRFKEDL